MNLVVLSFLLDLHIAQLSCFWILSCAFVKFAYELCTVRAFSFLVNPEASSAILTGYL
jgi:hypothetical protein